MARTRPRADKVLTVRLSEKELRRLEGYCILHERTKTEVVRDFIRRLEIPEQDEGLQVAITESLESQAVKV